MEQAPELWRREPRRVPQLHLTDEQRVRVAELAQLLLCKPADVCRIIDKYPRVGAWAVLCCAAAACRRG
jgi:hypothetical protein